VALDRQCLGGIWTPEGYEREIESPNSELWILVTDDRPHPGQPSPHNSGPIVNVPDAEANPGFQVMGLGCLWAIVDEAHITLLAIAPSHQGQGLGQFLLIQLLYQARRRGLTTGILEVRASNQVALNLYGKFGFGVVGRRRGYYQATGEDALILRSEGLQESAYGMVLTELEEKVLAELDRHGWQFSNRDSRIYPIQ
jgi:ribosomal-protein-alanine N-acetyltransferase